MESACWSVAEFELVGGVRKGGRTSWDKIVSVCREEDATAQKAQDGRLDG